MLILRPTRKLASLLPTASSTLLFGEVTNPSNGFYEKFGAERLYGQGGEFHGGYGWRDLYSLVANFDAPIPPDSGTAA